MKITNLYKILAGAGIYPYYEPFTSGASDFIPNVKIHIFGHHPDRRYVFNPNHICITTRDWIFVSYKEIDLFKHSHTATTWLAGGVAVQLKPSTVRDPVGFIVEPYKIIEFQQITDL